MQPFQPPGPGQPGPGPGQPAPYGPPQPYAQYPAPPPQGPRTIGTLSIVFGSITAAFSLLGLVGGKLGMAAAMMNPRTDASAMQEYLQAIRIPSLINSLLFIAMSVWLILLGVGQRRYRAWAARQSVIWGILGLAVVVSMIVVYFTITGPAAQRMMDQMTLYSGAHNPMRGVMSWAGLFGMVFYLPWPIILIVTFRKPAVVSAMSW